MRNRFVPYYLQYLFWIGVFLLVLFSAARVSMLLMNGGLISGVSFSKILYALFSRGLLFDASVISFIIAPVFLILAIKDFAVINSKYYSRASTWLVFIIGIIAIALSSADLPYFNYYNSRLTRTVFVLSANDSPWLILKDIFTNPLYFPFALASIIFSYLFWKFIRLLENKFLLTASPVKKWYTKTGFFLIAGYFLFSGLRGDINPDALPLKLEHAYFTDNTIVNQIGLNPVYSFLDSYREADLLLIPDDEAIRNVQNYLGIQPIGNSPIARFENANDTSIKPNVVLVMIESLSAAKMARYGNGNFMPFLDSIANHSLTFNNTYTAGIHTHNGIFSIHTGMPAIMRNTPMLSSATSTKPFAGLATSLKNEGYHTIFFMSGKRNFDNMQGFLPVNGYDELISKRDYPKEQWINRWGVPDHCIYDKSIAKLDSLANQGKPFLGTYMTISTHNPYSIPKGINFKPTSENGIDRSYEYADWSIKKFINDAKTKDWFNNTVFIFIADHGQNFSPIYDIPLSYHHTPMIFYSPNLIEPKQYEKLALQIDLYPTLMGILKTPYINNTLGVDLRTNDRPYAYFSADDKIGCIDEDFFLIINKSGKESLFNYRKKSLVNEAEKEKELVNDMKKYTFSMMQAAQWMITHRKTSPQFQTDFAKSTANE